MLDLHWSEEHKAFCDLSVDEDGKFFIGDIY
jgi:hypothetical protein